MSGRPSQYQLRDMLSDLLDIEEGLSDWEIGFVESLSRWDGDFTERQATALERCWNKHCLDRVTANDC
ncbi:MAG: hypothetical protein DRP65_00565 [Planctomycetota bacterium]|nr:MAG: hypothetical protein DRP65_00565 [Planctomycetota bacterium]